MALLGSRQSSRCDFKVVPAAESLPHRAVHFTRSLSSDGVLGAEEHFVTVGVGGWPSCTTIQLFQSRTEFHKPFRSFLRFPFRNFHLKALRSPLTQHLPLSSISAKRNRNFMNGVYTLNSAFGRQKFAGGRSPCFQAGQAWHLPCLSPKVSGAQCRLRKLCKSLRPLAAAQSDSSWPTGSSPSTSLQGDKQSCPCRSRTRAHLAFYAAKRSLYLCCVCFDLGRVVLAQGKQLRDHLREYLRHPPRRVATECSAFCLQTWCCLFLITLRT